MCPRCGGKMRGGVCEDCGFPINCRMKAKKHKLVVFGKKERICTLKK